MSTRSEATISYVGWASDDLAVFDEDSYGADDPAGYRDMDASMGASMGLGPQRLEPMFATKGLHCVEKFAGVKSITTAFRQCTLLKAYLLMCVGDKT